MVERLVVDEGGTTAIEYALIGSVVSIAIVAALSALGLELRFFVDITAALVDGAI